MSSGVGPVGVALIGAGKISEQYLANMALYPDLDVRFVADLFPDRAAEVAREFGVPASGTVAQALDSDDVEIVVNLTIPVAHAEVASAALHEGKHVWNEKPIAMDRESARAVLDQASSAGLMVGCAPDTFLGPGIQTALRMIRRGDIGRPLTASVVFQTPGPHLWHPSPEFLYQPGGGPVLDMGPYFLTALSQVFGPVAGVMAMASSAAPTRTIGQGPRAGVVFDVGVPTYVAAIYDFEAGGIAQATFSFDSPLVRVGILEIAGSAATLVIPDPNKFTGELLIHRAGDDEASTVTAPELVGGRGIGVVDIARALRTGGRHRASGELGLHVLDALLATAESVERKAFVEVDSPLESGPGAAGGLGSNRPHCLSRPPEASRTGIRSEGRCVDPAHRRRCCTPPGAGGTRWARAPSTAGSGCRTPLPQRGTIHPFGKICPTNFPVFPQITHRSHGIVYPIDFIRADNLVGTALRSVSGAKEFHVTEKSVMAASVTGFSADGPRPGRGRWLRGSVVATVAAVMLVAPVGAAGGADLPPAGDSTLAEVVVESGILLVGLPEGISLTGQPGEQASESVPFTYQVFTNNTPGYTVTVQASTGKMYAGSSDFIEVERLEVRDGAELPTTSWTEMSSTNPVLVYSRSGRSGIDGDNLSTSFRMNIPVVDAGTYTMTLNYVVAANL